MAQKRKLHDRFFVKAKEEGYVARSAYKLLEVQERRRVMRPGDRVLDLGCAPGSWLQVAAECVGPRGRVVGIDLTAVEHAMPAWVTHWRDDAFTVDPRALAAACEGREARRGGTGDVASERGDAGEENERGAHAPTQGLNPGVWKGFDVVLSDMAPSTTGDPSGDHLRSVALCERVIELLARVLRPGGNLVMKVFEGGEYPALLKRCEGLFDSCKGFRPEATRGVSREIFVVGEGYRGGGAGEGRGDLGNGRGGEDDRAKGVSGIAQGRGGGGGGAGGGRGAGGGGGPPQPAPGWGSA